MRRLILMHAKDDLPALGIREGRIRFPQITRKASSGLLKFESLRLPEKIIAITERHGHPLPRADRHIMSPDWQSWTAGVKERPEGAACTADP